MKIAYLAAELHRDGYKHQGVSLARHLDIGNDLRVCGAIAPQDSPLLQGTLADDVMSAEALVSVDVVYMEEGWNLGKSAPDRFPYELAAAFVRRGGQLIIADVGRRVAAVQHESLRASQDLLGARVGMGEMLGLEGVRYLYDEGACENGEFRFFVSEMTISDWLEPAMDGIESLLTSQPIHLLPDDAVAASGNTTTAVLVRDYFVEQDWPAPWATVSRHGRGHVAVIGAGLSYDYLIERCPDNARWLSNLVALLTERTRESVRWSTNSAESLQPDGATLRSLLADSESQQLERKASFSVPVDPRRKDVPTHIIQHAVAKNVAALANADGGHLIIGQADDLQIVGLSADYDQLTKHLGRDGFQLKLGNYLDSVLSPGWAPLQLKVHWLEQDGLDVAVIEVPQATEVVYLTDKKSGDEEAVYVRTGTRSGKLVGRNLTAWIKGRQHG